MPSELVPKLQEIFHYYSIKTFESQVRGTLVFFKTAAATASRRKLRETVGTTLWPCFLGSQNVQLLSVFASLTTYTHHLVKKSSFIYLCMHFFVIFYSSTAIAGATSSELHWFLSGILHQKLFVPNYRKTISIPWSNEIIAFWKFANQNFALENMKYIYA